jgi:hypothetical protein
MSPDATSSNRRLLVAAGLVGGTLVALAVPTVPLAWGAYLLDRRFGVFPWLTAIGLVLSLVVDAFVLAAYGKRMRDYMKSTV